MSLKLKCRIFVSMNQYGTQILSPNFFRARFAKRLRPAKKFISEIM